MDDSVSEFIVGTCRMLPKSSSNVSESMQFLNLIQMEKYFIVSGSCAEFFIQPLHSSIGDVDFLQMKPHSLAFTGEDPVLPYDLQHNSEPTDCMLMEPYVDYPAFVRLRLVGQIVYNYERKVFEFKKVKVQKFATTFEKDESDPDVNISKVGPSSRHSVSTAGQIDLVDATWCPQWPNKAMNWIFRRRKYGWPTNAVIHEIVENGCHVVFAQHPACRNDKAQWRLSFSIAEVILLQSWTPVQQIVYHMLKFFAQRELVKKDCPKENEVLCTYHFKTLMLWSSEEMSPEWWNSLSVVQICCNLLKKLEKWLKENTCRNYFIPEANLFHEQINHQIRNEIAKKLLHYCNSKNLSFWFMKHYVQPSLSNVFDTKLECDFISSEHMLQTLEAMKARYPRYIDLYVSIRFFYDSFYARSSVEESFQSTTVDVFKYSIRCLLLGDNCDVLPAAEYESCYLFYESMIFTLHAAQLLDCKEMRYNSEWFLDLIRHVFTKPKYIRSKHQNLPRPLNADVHEGRFYFMKAQNLMENLKRATDNIEFQVVSEISKRLLMKALEGDFWGRNVMINVALVYKAALHFAASEYQIAIDLVSTVIANKQHDAEEAETLNAGCLLYIEDISIIVGFYLIFMKNRDASLQYTEKQFFLDLRLTPKLFAHYLLIASIERANGAFEQNISETPIFPLDAILVAMTNAKPSQNSRQKKHIFCAYERTNPLHEFGSQAEGCLSNEDDIIHLLKRYSLMSMTSFYNAISKDFDIDCSTVECYRAAYLYQRRKYSEVVHLCERILQEPAIMTDLKELGIANIMILPPLDSFFDQDIQCLLGIHTLACYLLASSCHLWEIEVCKISTFHSYFKKYIYFKKYPLSKVLEEPYSTKCHYFLQRSFLGRYLKVRCLIDCKHSFSEVQLEFKKLNACLPFEQLIRCFLERKLLQLKKVIDVLYDSKV